MRRDGPAREAIWVAVALALVSVGPLVASGWTSPTPTTIGPAAVTDSTVRPAVNAADDWPTFMGGVLRTGANPGETALSVTTAPQLGLGWTYRTGGPIEGPATVVNGTLYIGSWDGYEYALNASTGSLVWRHFLGQLSNPNCNWISPIGITAGATVVGNRLFVAGGGSTFFALNASNGHVLWSRNTGPNGTSGTYLWASPLVYRGSVYVGVASQCDNPLVQGRLLQVYASNGTIGHAFYAVGNASSYETGGAIWSTPSLDPSTNTIWVTTGNEDTGSEYARCVVALNATDLSVIGSWQQPIAGYDFDFGAGATIAGAGRGTAWAVATNKDGYTYAFNRTNASTTGGWGPVWSDRTTSFPPYTHPPADAISPAAWDGRTLFVGGGNTSIGGTGYPGSVRAVFPSNGTYLWEHGSAGVVRGGVVYANGLVVDVAVSTAIANRSTLEVLNASTGRTLWSANITGTVNSNPTIAEGHIFLGTGSTDLTAWNAVPGGEPGLVEAFAPGPVQRLYPITFSETGLPAGTNWSVTLDGSTNRSTTTDIGFTEPNGTGYAFAIGRLSGYVAYPATGSLNVSGAGVTVMVRFAPLTFPLWFNETGLSAGALWSVTVNGTGSFSGSVSNGSTTPSIGFRVPPGFTGTFLLASPGGYTPTPNAGNVTVPNPGATVTVPIVFRSSYPPLYPLWFNATGLPSGVDWTVNMTGGVPGGPSVSDLNTSNTLSVGFEVPAGTTWAFRVSPPLGFDAVPVGGNVTMPSPGAPVTQAIEFLPSPPSIVGFSVNPSSIFLGGKATFEVIVSDGAAPLAYAYGHLPPGCPSPNASNITCSPSRAGVFRVSVLVTDQLDRSTSANVTLTVLATPVVPTPTHPSPSPTVLGLPEATGYAVIGGILAVVAVIAAVLLGRRRPKRDAEPAQAQRRVTEPPP